jgi:hypothetical protein
VVKKVVESGKGDPAHGPYLDRKRTLPKRVLKLALALAALKTGDHVFVVRAEDGRDLTWQHAELSKW